jgi:hypothetical protein
VRAVADSNFSYNLPAPNLHVLPRSCDLDLLSARGKKPSPSPSHLVFLFARALPLQRSFKQPRCMFLRFSLRHSLCSRTSTVLWLCRQQMPLSRVMTLPLFRRAMLPLRQQASARPLWLGKNGKGPLFHIDLHLRTDFD